MDPVNTASARVIRPSTPLATVSRIHALTGWEWPWKASATRLWDAPAADTTRRASAAVIVNGFSHSTSLPARSAAMVHSACIDGGSTL